MLNMYFMAAARSARENDFEKSLYWDFQNEEMLLFYRQDREALQDHLLNSRTLSSFLKECYEISSEEAIYRVAYDWSVFPIIIKYVMKNGCL